MKNSTNNSKPLTWLEAVKYMKRGGKVRRKSWLPFDYLYLKDGLIYCDGGFPYLTVCKQPNRLKTGLWVKVKAL
jgi:hypothetical protein